MDGIALAYSALPVELIERHQLSKLVHDRGGELEFWFLKNTPLPILPVLHDGQYRIVAWGSRTGRLPRSGVTWLETVESGRWSTGAAVSVEIPATLGLHNGIWYPIRRGVRGVLAETTEEAAVYVIVKRPSHYYHVMTRRSYAPILIDQEI